MGTIEVTAMKARCPSAALRARRVRCLGPSERAHYWRSPDPCRFRICPACTARAAKFQAHDSPRCTPLRVALEW